MWTWRWLVWFSVTAYSLTSLTLVTISSKSQQQVCVFFCLSSPGRSINLLHHRHAENIKNTGFSCIITFVGSVRRNTPAVFGSRPHVGRSKSDNSLIFLLHSRQLFLLVIHPVLLFYCNFPPCATWHFDWFLHPEIDFSWPVDIAAFLYSMCGVNVYPRSRVSALGWCWFVPPNQWLPGKSSSFQP